jgi:transcriptional regulator with XRE-family HTH domain
MKGTIVDRLRGLVADLEAGGMTRSAIAERAGIDKGTLSKFMSGRHLPNLLTAVRLAGAAGRRLDLFVVEKSQP